MPAGSLLTFSNPGSINIADLSKLESTFRESQRMEVIGFSQKGN